MASEGEDLEYICFVCDVLLKEYFYVCSKAHVFCSICSKGGLCPMCHTTRILCCHLKMYDSSPKEAIFEKSGGSGPIISLPDYDKSENADECVKTFFGNRYPHTRMLKCLDCRKLLSGGMLCEHYRREHPDVPICPVPLGAYLSFKFNLHEVPRASRYLDGFKRMQILKLVRHKQLFTGFEKNSDDKLLFIMATRVQIYQSHTAVLLWLTAHYHGSSLCYSMEARNAENNIATTMFTGTTVGPKAMDEVFNGRKLIEDIGQYLCVKDTLIKTFEEEGSGVIINTIIHDVQ